MPTSHIDLELGSMITVAYHNSESDDEEDIRSICFSDADEGSCYSTAGGSHDEVSDVSESRRDSSASDCSVFVEILREDELVKVHLDDDEEENKVGDELRQCRICHLNLGTGNGVIELGCACKNDLALAHSSCAERWFKIRGNRVCEICNSIVENVHIVISENVNIAIEVELMQQSTTTMAATIVTAQPVPPSPAARPDTTRSFCRGHRFLNFLLACMVFAFVISWLFRFNVPS